MPPSRSGIADYSAALAAELSLLAELTCFTNMAEAEGYDPAAFDLAVYQLGNNLHHDFVYETALRHPGVVVMHEANLHHLLTDLTIRRNDWDAYVAECAYNGGTAAEAMAKRVRALEIGPDYEGLPMTRRVLESARGVIVHSQFMVDQIRAGGYKGPIARIPHGAWIADCEPLGIGRNGIRKRLGLDESTPLIGTFGFLKPYKRIAESLRAFRRLTKVEPRARLVLGGEPHPDFPLQQTIEALGLDPYARILGFTAIEDFAGYIEACDIVLNLRFPTVGETSGSLLRALGAGRAVLVSDVGAFSELPDDVCLKVPTGLAEEDTLFEYLNLLVSRPDLATAMGERARAWVEKECSWAESARQYERFMFAVQQGLWKEPEDETVKPPLPPPVEQSSAPQVIAGESPVGAAEAPQEDAAPTAAMLETYVKTWAVAEDSKGYVEVHKTRLARTLEITPQGGPDDRVLEMGAYMQITPALHNVLGYGEVRGCYYGPPGRIDHSTVTSENGETFTCDIDHFDAEKDIYPYADESFQTVLCCELIEHLFTDPMHLMSEVNRILKPGGHFVLTTPNITSLRAVEAILQGYHPGFFHAYIKPSASGEVDARHNREYTPAEIQHLLTNSGFAMTLLDTGPFRDEPRPELAWVDHLLRRYHLHTGNRGDGIYAVGRKTGAVKDRWPSWLYA
jgi:glycosyltransferase involved in cell wall biosynthesis/SAM-dependent methyltransferase